MRWRREYPYSMAAAVTVSSLVMTFNTATLAFDMPGTVTRVATQERPARRDPCREPRHLRARKTRSGNSPADLRFCLLSPQRVRRARIERSLRAVGSRHIATAGADEGGVVANSRREHR
jgi:hypothetical protein